MAITLDTIVNKVFKVVKNGYDNNEVESFLDEILEEMENREAETNKLKEQVAQLTAELNQARADLQAAKSAQPAVVAAAPAARPAQDDRHSSESFELVLSKAKGAYEEIGFRGGYPCGGNHQQGQSGRRDHPFGCAEQNRRFDQPVDRAAQADLGILRFPQKNHRCADRFHGADQASAVSLAKQGETLLFCLISFFAR